MALPPLFLRTIEGTGQFSDVRSLQAGPPSRDRPVTTGLLLENPLPFQSLAAPTLIESSGSRSSSGGGRPHPQAPANAEIQAGRLLKKPAGQRLVSVTMSDGAPIDDAQYYTVTTNDFVMAGGDGFSEVGKGADIKDTGILLRDVFVDYVKAHVVLSPALDGRVMVLKQ